MACAGETQQGHDWGGPLPPPPIDDNEPVASLVPVVGGGDTHPLYLGLNVVGRAGEDPAADVAQEARWASDAAVHGGRGPVHGAPPPRPLARAARATGPA